MLAVYNMQRQALILTQALVFSFRCLALLDSFCQLSVDGMQRKAIFSCLVLYLETHVDSMQKKRSDFIPVLFCIEQHTLTVCKKGDFFSCLVLY